MNAANEYLTKPLAVSRSKSRAGGCLWFFLIGLYLEIARYPHPENMDRLAVSGEQYPKKMILLQ